MGDFECNQAWAQRLFERDVSPILCRFLAGEVFRVEGEPSPTLRMLDMDAGIDYFHRSRAGLVRGIANRVQASDRDWATFTIRKSRDSGARTEYEKRTIAIESGAIYPFFTVQSYFDTHERLTSFAIVRTEHLFRAVRQGLAVPRRTSQHQIGQAEFLAVGWRDLLGSETPMIMHDHKTRLTVVRDATQAKEYMDSLTDEDINQGFSDTIDDPDGLETDE